MAVEYGTLDKQGVTKRQHLEQAGAVSPMPEVPVEAQHVWEWFWALSAARGSNGFSLVPIAYTEIEAWARLTGAEPEPWEVMAIKAMDKAMLEESRTDG